MKIFEVALPTKAGVIPYFNGSNGIEMLFMIPSDPAYGGSDPQIAKGNVDDGETTQQAAMREGKEELGLLQSNVKLTTSVGTTVLTGLNETYNFSLFVAEVRNPRMLIGPHYETGKVLWLTIEEFKQTGRKEQLNFVQKAYQIINRLI